VACPIHSPISHQTSLARYGEQGRRDLGGIGNIATLEDALTAVWNGIPNERLESLIRSMREQLEAVLDADAGATKY